jgi:hypothetical protein
MTCSLKLFIIFACFVFFCINVLYKDGIAYICLYIIKKLFISKLKVEFAVEIKHQGAWRYLQIEHAT